MHVFNSRKIVLWHHLLKDQRHFDEVGKGHLAFVEDSHAACQEVDQPMTELQL
jgi:hypothetical protein